MPFTKNIDTGIFSLRSTLRKGSCKFCPLDIKVLLYLRKMFKITLNSLLQRLDRFGVLPKNPRFVRLGFAIAFSTIHQQLFLSECRAFVPLLLHEASEIYVVLLSSVPYFNLSRSKWSRICIFQYWYSLKVTHFSRDFEDERSLANN